MLDFSIVFSKEHLRDSLEISPGKLYFDPGDYSYLSAWTIFSTPMSKPAYVLGIIQAGQYYDGYRLSVRFEPMWNISKHFELGGTYNFDHVNVSSRNVTWPNHIVGIKALYMLNTKFSVNAFLQYNQAIHEIITNLRIRYNPKEGNDLYLVFNEGRNTDLTREVPNLPIFSSRTILLKYTYTFNL